MNCAAQAHFWGNGPLADLLSASVPEAQNIPVPGLIFILVEAKHGENKAEMSVIKHGNTESINMN